MVLLNGFDIAVLHIIAEDQLSGLHVIPLRIRLPKNKKKIRVESPLTLGA